ncbi:MAG: transposase [Cryomorphaceae bacterium]
MTIYLFVIHEEQRVKIKQIHHFATDYLRSWFPNIGSYAAFNNRINRLSSAFSKLGTSLTSEFKPDDCSPNISLLDSMPIVVCSGKRSARVAPELIDKSYCSTKRIWYHGLKLHALGFHRAGKLPFPEQLLVSAASENDLNVFKQAWSNFSDRTFFGDKIYTDKPFFAQLKANENSIMLTPVKAVKGQTQWEVQFGKAANDLFSQAVSALRQPIEAFFNWLIEKTDIQRAGKVRSTKGLLVHVFGKIAAGLIGLIFNS